MRVRFFVFGEAVAFGLFSVSLPSAIFSFATRPRTFSLAESWFARLGILG